MLLERSSKVFIDIEEKIINSNTFFNLVSKDKEILSKEEILDEIEQSEKIGAHRYLIKEKHEFIGILEYLLLNPNDQCTWLGLLLIENNLHLKGYGTKALELFYVLMKSQGINKIRIGVIAENTPAHIFWQKHGFLEIRTTINNDNKTIVIYEKEIS